MGHARVARVRGTRASEFHRGGFEVVAIQSCLCGLNGVLDHCSFDVDVVKEQSDAAFALRDRIGKKCRAGRQPPSVDLLARRVQRVGRATLVTLLRVNRIRRFGSQRDQIRVVRLEPRGLLAIRKRLHRTSRFQMLAPAGDQLADQPRNDRLAAAVAAELLALEQLDHFFEPPVAKGHYSLSDPQDQHDRCSVSVLDSDSLSLYSGGVARFSPLPSGEG